MKKVLLIISFVLGGWNLYSQTSLAVDLQKNSWIAIYGTTNILSFKLLHSGDKIADKTINITATQNHNRIYLSQNQLSLKINNFHSDNKMALRDFQKLMKSETYPTLDIQLNYIETAPGVEKETNAKGNVIVNITITGVTKPYSIPVSSIRHGDYVSVDGTKKISIRDFGLEPPEEMLGLIKVSEWISIQFHFVCKFTIEKDNTSLSAKKG